MTFVNCFLVLTQILKIKFRYAQKIIVFSEFNSKNTIKKQRFFSKKIIDYF